MYNERPKMVLISTEGRLTIIEGHLNELDDLDIMQDIIGGHVDFLDFYGGDDNTDGLSTCCDEDW